MKLLTDEVVLLDGLSHLLRHQDRLQLLVAVHDGIPLALGVLDHRLQLLGVEGVDDVEEVVLLQLPSLVDFWGQVASYRGALLEFVVQVLDGELRLVTDLDELHVFVVEKQFLPVQDQPNPLFRHVLDRRAVHLWVIESNQKSILPYLEIFSEVGNKICL